MITHTDLIIERIKFELERAEKKHPVWPRDPLHAISIVTEESGEAVKATLQYIYENGSIDNIENELTQTAAIEEDEFS